MGQVTMATEYPCAYVYTCLWVCTYVFGVRPQDETSYQLGLMNQIESLSLVYAYQRRLEEKIKIPSTY